MSKDTTILVKKADGTLVRMTLEEIKKLKQGSKAAAPKAPAAPTTLALLEETVVNPHPTAPFTSLPREDQVGEVLSRLSFKASPTVANRLRTAVQLCLKDVRSKEATQNVLTRSEKDGGVALTAPQAAEIIALCTTVDLREGKKVAAEPVKPLRGGALMVESPHELSIAAPNNSFKHAVLAAKPKPPEAKPAPTAPRPLHAEQPPVFTLAKETKRPAMHDISSKPVEMTPVDELQYLTLTDFRRLSTDPVEAATRLRQKFTNLREESIILFLKALDAWHLSPLYQDYIAVILTALLQKQQLPTATIVDKRKIQYNEVRALAEMNASL